MFSKDSLNDFNIKKSSAEYKANKKFALHLIGPFPIFYFRHIITIFNDVMFMFDQFISHGLF